MASTLHIGLRPLPTLVLVAALVLLPVALMAVDQPFYIVLASRVLIYALIASSLNLLIGYGGMVSLGHACFVGAGAYTTAVLVHAGIGSAWLAWPAAALAGAVLAAMIGAVSLRTRGVYFIMITLAFAQMAYYVVVSLRALGGDDGLVLPRRTGYGFGLDPHADMTFYYAVLGVVLLLMAGLRRLLNAPLGRALQAIRDNDVRMEAIGFPVFRIQLAGFVIAGATAGLGGGLLADLNQQVSPSLLHWTQSGTLMVMVILGGAGRFLGGALGAAVLLLAQELFSDVTTHTALGIGLVLLAVVLFAPAGLAGLWRQVAR
ncbi:branched-chain amino acid ABC transporter permease [Vineibacter terrae]|uniref:branched-chain amino acid ABC transporter permease n=1 Tax=Vineibacter terrae TaxID=2586908 RepID=UPI002E30CA73|nr:branched-chain amino acid ABC transporter permease [Vineibacter terrae]HEX2891709.1 branched-chain amino acid ABC transporter permease [Vineibacter terrae]